MGIGTTKLTLYSQNIGCDRKNESLITISGLEKMDFKTRFQSLIKNLSMNKSMIDVVAFNEIRYEENIQLVLKSLHEIGFTAKLFSNNGSSLSFHNVLAVNNSSKWKPTSWEHKWVAYEDQKYCLANKHSLIEGDSHGRCAGIVYLRIISNRSTHKMVCVMVSHVLPFGEVKVHQQNSLFSLNLENTEKLSVPTFIIGDMNRFNDENENFQQRLKDYNLTETKLQRLIVTSADGMKEYKNISNQEDIGTFMPWPVDEVYAELLTETLSKSRLDVHLYTNDPKKVVVKNAYAKAIMCRDPPQNNPTNNVNSVRYILDKNMVSDHIAIVGTYKIK